MQRRIFGREYKLEAVKLRWAFLVPASMPGSIRPPGDHARYDEVLLDKITQSFKSSDRTYGARRVWHDVLAEGLSSSH